MGDGITPFGKYVLRVTGDVPQNAIAARVGTDKATIWRWLHTDITPSVGHVIKFARAYNVPVVEALVAAGHITEAEAKIKRTSPAVVLARMSTSELLDELSRRTGAGDAA